MTEVSATRIRDAVAGDNYAYVASLLLTAREEGTQLLSVKTTILEPLFSNATTATRELVAVVLVRKVWPQLFDHDVFHEVIFRLGTVEEFDYVYLHSPNFRHILAGGKTGGTTSYLRRYVMLGASASSPIVRHIMSFKSPEEKKSFTIVYESPRIRQT